MHIAIEGLDGSGKTTTAQRVAEIIGFNFIEKPLHYFTDLGNSFENYMNITGRINISKSSIKARFYGLGNYYVSLLSKDNNVVTDRHLASNYYWNCEDDEKFFKQLVADCGAPDLTIILFAEAEERRRRILERNPNDKDLEQNVFDNEPYIKMKYFLDSYKMNYLLIDTTNIRQEEVVDIIVDEIIRIMKGDNKYEI